MNRFSAVNQRYENNASDRIVRPVKLGHDAERMQVVHVDAFILFYLLSNSSMNGKSMYKNDIDDILCHYWYLSQIILGAGGYMFVGVVNKNISNRKIKCLQD